MIEALAAPGHVAAFRLTGLITGEDVEKAIAEVEARLKADGPIAVYSDVTGFSDATSEAIARRVQYGLSKLGQIHRFARMAVITDKKRSLPTRTGSARSPNGPPGSSRSKCALSPKSSGSRPMEWASSRSAA